MLSRIKYNFWLIVFITNTLFFLFFLYQALSFTSVYAFRWLFFLSTPFFTSGIHLLIKSRSTRAEWLSVINFGFTALLIIYFNTLPDALYQRWPWLSIPIFNQLFINTFDVIWTNNYLHKLIGVISIGILWSLTLICLLMNLSWGLNWIPAVSAVVGVIIIAIILLGSKSGKTG